MVESHADVRALLAAAVSSLAVGVAYGVRAAGRPHDGASGAFPQAGEKFGYRRAFRALGYATAIVAVGGALAVHAVCAHLDVWTARDFAAAMQQRLAAPRDRVAAALQPTAETVGVATKRVVHAGFDAAVEGVQARLSALLSPTPAPPDAVRPVAPRAGES
ncbi:hypothetical protein KFE25_012809 [Diacronema lutheri]|uniref:Uncharacterized protein n=1 Tax=Diacronema lutheri TaxID=2081491 RepID=A0A8J6C3N5_DIALT|nr:hypothetical protein KFE25_012809 [Diacronema lutheri]